VARACSNSVTDLVGYRSPSLWFSYRMPADNVGQLPQVCGQSFRRGAMPPTVEHHPGATADGFYLMLAPLSPGEHSLHFGGTASFPRPDKDPFIFMQNINYKITVTCLRGQSSRARDRAAVTTRHGSPSSDGWVRT
jgi:hypothetical protein